MDNENQVIDLNIVDLLLYFLKKAVWIILIAAVITGGAFGFTKFFVTPEYTASTRVYIMNKSGANDSSLSYSDLQSSATLATDYEVLITGTNVTSIVISKLNLNISNAQLKSKISVESVGKSRILQINVVDENPELAAKIANEVRRVAQEQIVKIMENDAVNLVYEASVPVSPSSPNVKKNTIIAFVAGLTLGLVIFLISFLRDDSIKTEEDVEKFLKLSTLAVIPLNDSLSSEKKNKSKR